MTGTDQTNEQSATAVTIEWNHPPFLNTALEDKKNEKLRIICQGVEPLCFLLHALDSHRSHSR